MNWGTFSSIFIFIPRLLTHTERNASEAEEQLERSNFRNTHIHTVASELKVSWRNRTRILYPLQTYTVAVGQTCDLCCATEDCDCGLMNGIHSDVTQITDLCTVTLCSFFSLIWQLLNCNFLQQDELGWALRGHKNVSIHTDYYTVTLEISQIISIHHP